jgi:hypothetical protein
MWSFSSGRLFEKCQRAWFYKSHVASATSLNPLQREAYLLSKLQSISAWRGRIVDEVISSRIVPALKKGWNLEKQAILQYARLLFDDQRSFAKANSIRQEGMSQAKAGRSFAAFYVVEYGIGVKRDDLVRAWQEIKQALSNLIEMRKLLEDLRQAERLISQRSLTFSVLEAKARAVPDLIVFFVDQPPLIVDWKVHAFANRDYRLQLAAYALALVRSSPHQDFPASLAQYEPEDVRLIEAQLLRNVLRPYKLIPNDIDGLENHIVDSFMEMNLAMGESPTKSLNAFDYPVTEYAGVCEQCPFRKLCWEDPVWQESKQMTLL